MPKKRNGFTLVEVLLVVVLLSVGMIAAHQAFGRVLHAIKYSEEAVYARLLLEREAVDLALQAWAKIPSEPKKHASSGKTEYGAFTVEKVTETVQVNGLDMEACTLRVRGPSGAESASVLLLPGREHAVS